MKFNLISGLNLVEGLRWRIYWMTGLLDFQESNSQFPNSLKIDRFSQSINPEIRLIQIQTN